MIDACTDIYQPFRMALVWPIIVGCVAFYGVRFIASTRDGQLTRWQAVLAGDVRRMATCGAWRLRFIGRLVAVLAFVFWVTMAVATTSTTSMLIDAMFAYAMFGEIVTQRGDCT